MFPLKRAGDEFIGSVMGEIFVLPHYKPIIGGNETVYLTRDPSNIWDEEAIRVEKIIYPIFELVGYLEHKNPCVLCALIDCDLIRIHGTREYSIINLECMDTLIVDSLYMDDIS